MRHWNSVVVGVDESPESARAARLGSRIAEAAGTDCRLIHVVRNYPIESSVVAMTPKLATLQPALVNETGRRVEAALRQSVPEDVASGLKVYSGPAAMVLVDAAQDAALLVLGGKHHSLPGRWLAGSTAHQVLRMSRTPVLIAGESAEPPRRVLAAVDLSAGAEPTLFAAEQIAGLFRAALRVLHVVELLPPPASVQGVAIPPAGAVDAETWYGMTEAAFARNVWPLVNYPGAEPLVTRGTPEPEIRRHASAWGADLLVVGTHGKGLIDRLLVGSVTHHLLNDLPCPLFVVPVSAGVPVLQAESAR